MEESLNTMLAIKSITEKQPDPFCPTCAAFLDSLKVGFQQKNLQNNLEPIQENFKNVNIQCVADTMAYGKNFNFSSCELGKYKTKEAMPCISKNYATVVHDSFIESAHCLGLSTAEMFPLYARESAFHVNAISGTGCRGLGQLCTISVHEMDNVDKRDTDAKPEPFSRKRLAEKKECAHVKNALLTPARLDKVIPKCELIQLPENPTANFLYSMRTYAKNRAKASDKIVKFATKLNKLNFKEKDINQLTIFLARMMYNGGPDTILNRFSTFMKNNSNLSPANIQSKFMNYVSLYYPDDRASRRKETAYFPKDVEKAGDNILSKGKPCFQ